MHVYCTHCGQQIPAEDLNIETVIARCRACDAVFSFADALEQEDDARPVRSHERQPVPLPAGIREESYGGALRYVHRWYRGHFLFLLFFCIAWDAFLLFWYGIAFTQDVPWIMIVFPIAHVAVGVGLTYYTVCGFVNKTVIEIGSWQLSLKHGPLPWPGNRTLDSSSIDQLYCRRKISRNDNSTSETYELHAITKDNKKLKLLSGFTEPEQALYLEQEIEKALQIKDRPVRGEYRG